MRILSLVHDKHKDVSSWGDFCFSNWFVLFQENYMVLRKMQSVLFMSACDVVHCCSLVISDSVWKDNQKLQVENIFIFFFNAKLIKYLFHFHLKMYVLQILLTKLIELRKK